MRELRKLGLGLPAVLPAALAAGLALSACQQAEPAVHANNQTPKVVSLNPCTDAVLVEVAQTDQILALSHYSTDPNSSSMSVETASKFEATGGTVEEVLALNPDRVIAGAFIAPSSEQALRNLGLPLEKFGSVNSVEDSIAQIARLAEIMDGQVQGRALIGKIEAAVERHSAPQGTSPIATILWQPSEIVPGNQTLITQLLDRAGFSSHSAAMGLGQADRLSLEQLLADPPELVLIAGDSAGQTHPLLAHLEDTRVEYFDPKLLYCGGPTIIAAMERLAQIRGSLR